jgi:histidine kinase
VQSREALYRIESTPLPGTHRVFAATRLRDGASVAVKRPRGPYAKPEDVGALRHEWTVLKHLDGAKVAHALDFISERGAFGLVLELAQGRPLNGIIEREQPDPKRSVVLALAAARSLADVHARGFVHRDIKPNHFFIDEAEGKATIIDFGLATALPRERHLPVEVDRLEGTLPYISPEQTGRMNRSVDRRSDLYSLGVTLYELCTGKLPFASEDALELVHAHIARAPAPPRTFRTDLPEVLENIILRLLAKSPDERYQTSAGLVADLEAWSRISSAFTASYVAHPRPRRSISLAVTTPASSAYPRSSTVEQRSVRRCSRR